MKSKRWLVPYILISICFFVASIGAFVAIIVTVVEDFKEEMLKANNDQVKIIANIAVLR